MISKITRTALVLPIYIFLSMTLTGFSTEFFEHPEAYAPPGQVRYLPELQVIRETEKIEEVQAAFTNYELPDLRTLPAYDLRLIVDTQNGARHLKFSNSIWNAGEGPLEFRGATNNQGGEAEVYQVLYENGEPADEIPMGNFYFSESHNHWHWDGFSKYQIWSIQEDGALDELLVESGKVGYCIRDDSKIDELNVDFNSPEIADRPAYTICSTRVQGLSAGWVDTYAYNTPGQTLDITGVPEGIFALRSVADPSGGILEEDKDNNDAITYFELERFRVRVVDKPDIQFENPKIKKDEAASYTSSFCLSPRALIR